MFKAPPRITRPQIMQAQQRLDPEVFEALVANLNYNSRAVRVLTPELDSERALARLAGDTSIERDALDALLNEKVAQA